jgi:hypothetical protein
LRRKKMSDHTPGPWKTEAGELDVYIVASEGDKETTLAKVDMWPSPSQFKANARIMAAAPQMLEALRKIWDAVIVYPHRTDDAILLVEQAIKAATGDSDESK